MVTLDWSSRIRAGSSPSCKRQMTVLRFMRPTRSRPLRSSAFQRLIFNKPFQRYHKHDALFFPCHFNYKEFRLGPRPVTDMVSLHTPSNDGEMQNQNTIPGHILSHTIKVARVVASPCRLFQRHSQLIPHFGVRHFLHMQLPPWTSTTKLTQLMDFS